ncbi:hypothetical protein FDP41_013091 [Naegleria fowleri]|uniref:Uncharacterized protein n=1 Tax=Naegleria fowleri TaxID=5763 RepID=A0A6A5C425_NAEFO|nr:uncharacterized protein FDP41_013091 [Naegleria fowleri]KAF0980608.1 hypothetical protein FDP41_013091 [Naegleria fowleri]CAG4715367.1 unnamed protein product [Naegleria fowleri]
MKPYNYQIELAQEAIKRNIVCVCPTGSGKTLIAALVIDQLYHQDLVNHCSEHVGERDLCPCHYCEKNSSSLNNASQHADSQKTFFIVPTNALRKQQQDTLTEYFSTRKCSRVKVKKDFVICNGKTWNVLVCTAQSLLNALDNDTISMKDVKLLIFDEAHHAVGDHPYIGIMRKHYHSHKNRIENAEMNQQFMFMQENDVTSINTLPRILGLTATPTSHSLHKNVIDMHAQSLKKNKLEFFLDVCIIAPRHHIEEMQCHTANTFQHVLTYKKSENIETIQIMKDFCSGYSALTDYKSIIDEEYNCLGEMGVLFSFQYLSGKEKIVDSYREFEMKYQHLDHLRDSSFKFEIIEQIRNSPYLSSKVKSLFELLIVYKNTVGENNAKCIIFVEKIAHVKVLTKILRSFTEFDCFNCSELVGISSMSRKNQQNIVKDFSRRKVKLLVATKSGEEGINVSKCSLVIQYDLCNTTKEHLQSKGRARFQNSHYIIFSEEGNFEHKNIIRNLEKTLTEPLSCFTFEQFREMLISSPVSIPEDENEQDDGNNESNNETYSSDEEEEMEPFYVPTSIRNDNLQAQKHQMEGMTLFFSHLNGFLSNFSNISFGILTFQLMKPIRSMKIKNLYGELNVDPKCFFRCSTEEFDILQQFHMLFFKILCKFKSDQKYSTEDGRFYIITPTTISMQSEPLNPHAWIDWQFMKQFIRDFGKNNSTSQAASQEEPSILDIWKSGQSIPTDRIIVTMYNNFPYFLLGVDFSRNLQSPFNDTKKSSTFKQYYEQKYKLVVTDCTQPLLTCSAERAGKNSVFLIPEFCRRTCFSIEFYNLSRLVFTTSNELNFLSLLEQLLIVEDLREAIKLPTSVDGDIIRKAITHRSAQNLDFNYERLEFMGDSILKYAATMDIVLKYPSETMKFYNEERQSKVSNANLKLVARKFGLQQFYIETQYYHHKVAGFSYTKSKQIAAMRGKKLLANMMESLTGALSENDMQYGVTFLKNMGIIERDYFTWDGFLFSNKPSQLKEKIEMIVVDMRERVNILQHKLSYQFKEPLYAYLSLLHPSANIGGNAHNDTLEFVGDAVLDLYIVRTLYQKFNFDESVMTDFKSQFVKNTSLQEIADESQLAPLLFIPTKQLKGKIVSDMIEAIIGAVALDCGMNWEVICKVIENSFLQEPLQKWLERVQQYAKENQKEITSLPSSLPGVTQSFMDTIPSEKFSKDENSTHSTFMEFISKQFNNIQVNLVLKVFLDHLTSESYLRNFSLQQIAHYQSLFTLNEMPKIILSTSPSFMKWYYLDQDNDWILFDTQHEWEYFLSNKLSHLLSSTTLQPPNTPMTLNLTLGVHLQE